MELPFIAFSLREKKEPEVGYLPISGFQGSIRQGRPLW